MAPGVAASRGQRYVLDFPQNVGRIRLAGELLVVSGAGRIWSSRDCPDGAAASVVTVEPQGEQEVAVAWPRQRSGEGCPSGLPEPRAGTYQLTGSVGGTTSAPVVFDLS